MKKIHEKNSGRGRIVAHASTMEAHKVHHQKHLNLKYLLPTQTFRMNLLLEHNSSTFSPRLTRFRTENNINFS